MMSKVFSIKELEAHDAEHAEKIKTEQTEHDSRMPQKSAK